MDVFRGVKIIRNVEYILSVCASKHVVDKLLIVINVILLCHIRQRICSYCTSIDVNVVDDVLRVTR